MRGCSISTNALFLLLFHWGSTTFGLQYGPSLDFLIPPHGAQHRKEIHLDGFFPTYSVTLPLTNGSATALVSQVHPQGEFSILAPQGQGIMVVIQHLRLRTTVVNSPHPDDVAYSLMCRDFLKFSAGNQTKQVCGHVMKYSKEGSPAGLLGPRMFITSDAQMTMSLYVDADQARHDYGWHETIAAEITVTAFTPCPKNNLVSQIKKWTGRNPLRSCSPSEDKICVHYGTLCDGVGNCGVKGPLGHVGFDEENCGGIRAPPPTDTPFRSPSSEITTKTPYIGVNKPYTPPTTGKVISPIHLILIFSIIVLIIFGACTWLAKANEKKFQHTMYRFSTMRRNRRNNHRTTHPIVAEEETIRRPSAPSMSTTNTLSPGMVMVEGVEEPPPYDHLFPSAPPATATSTLTYPSS